MTTAILPPSLEFHPRCDVLGVRVSAIDLPLAVRTIEAWIELRHKTYVCITGVHGVMESQREPELKRIHNTAGMVTPDGMPMVWMNWLKGFRHVRRVYGPDLMLEVCRASASKGYRHYFYGGAEGVAERLAARLRERFGGLQVAGAFSPPFRTMTEDEDRQIVHRINRANSDIVWIGLSTPKQERWMAGHLGRLDAPVMVGVGAAFDFLAGLKRQAPRWMQRSGLEWLFRLGSEPRRLWRRYLSNNPRFVAHLAMQCLGLKDYRLNEAGAARQRIE